MATYYVELKRNKYEECKVCYYNDKKESPCEECEKPDNKNCSDIPSKFNWEN